MSQAESSQKTVAITGGASGLGEATARRFAADGYRVVILDQNGEQAKAVAADIGEMAQAHQLDVTDEAATEALAQQIWSEHGGCDALFTSAGILENCSTVMDMDLKAHDQLWEVNYRGTILSCRAFGRRMIQQKKGTIVTVGSICSTHAFPLPAYNPSKTAILRLTEILSVELGRHGVRVNGVAPTYVITPAVQARIDAGERDPEVIRNAGALDMLVKPANIASVVAFLCSDDAAAVAGVMLPVDAGWSPATPYKSYAGGMPWNRPSNG